MSKRSFFIILGITFCLILIKPGYGVNLLGNPSLETWTSLTQPGTWTVEDTNYSRVTKESTVVFHGTYAAKLKRLQAGTGNNKGLLQRITLPGRGRFIARARFMDNTDSVSGGLTITWRRSDESFISSWSTVYTVNSPNWQVVERSGVNDTAPLDAGIADFLVRTYGTSTTPAGGTIVVDSIFFDRFAAIEENDTPTIKTALRLEVTPNPFTNSTMINFSLNPASFRAVKIFDATGNLIQTITSMNPVNGAYVVTWDGRNNKGVLSAPGVYFTVLETTSETKTVKTLFLR